MSSRWSGRPDVPRGRTYDARWEALAASGADVHGEAGFVDRRLAPGAMVLDAGCGTGRVAIELTRRGHHATGVDLDPAMLAVAQEKAPDADWHLGDLATLDLPDRYDAVVLAGNVLLFVSPGTECQVMARCAAHLKPGGLLIAGFALSPGRYSLPTLDADATSATLTLTSRFSTWSETPFTPETDTYAVSVFTRTQET